MDERVRLHPVVQAVDLMLNVGGRAVHAVVSRSVFETYYGATGAPDSWLSAYAANKRAVQKAIERKAASHPEATILVLLDTDIDQPNRPKGLWQRGALRGPVIEMLP